MASYFVPTVVQTTISNPDMTPLERLVLSHIFEAEPDGDGLYFFAEESPAECIEVDAAELRAAHRDSAGVDCVLDSIAAERLAETADADTHIELDLSMTSWATIFQDIVRRSPTLGEIVVTSAFTCSPRASPPWPPRISRRNEARRSSRPRSARSAMPSGVSRRSKKKGGKKRNEGAMPHARPARQGRLRPRAAALDPPDRRGGPRKGVMKG